MSAAGAGSLPPPSSSAAFAPFSAVAPSSTSTSASSGPAAGPSSSSAASASAAAQSSSSPVELRASLLCLARCAERSERWDDVCRFVKESIKLAPLIPQQPASTAQPPQPQQQQADSADLSDEERALLQLAYKHVIGQQRAAWKVMRQIQQAAMQQQQAAQQAAQQQQQSSAGSGTSGVQQQQQRLDDARFLELSEDYKQQLEKEIHLQCSELIHLLESVLLKSVQRAESKCVYLKLAGDMYRYLAELVLARTGWTAAGCAGGYDKKAHECYALAYKLAAQQLPPNHPVRLQCALNLSVCLYEILRERKAACDVAKQAFDGAIAKLEELEEAKYKDATLIMQLLRDNLTLWTQQASGTAQQQQQQQQQHAQQPA